MSEIKFYHGLVNKNLIYSIVYNVRRRVKSGHFYDQDGSLYYSGDSLSELQIADIQEYINRFSSRVADYQSRVKERVIASSHSQVSTYKAKTNQQSSLDGRSVKLSDSQHTIFEELEKLFCRFAKAYNAQYRWVSSLLNRHELQQTYSLELNAHQITCTCDFNSEGTLNHFLVPAVCLSLYPTLAGSKIKEGSAFWIKGKAFRREAGVFDGQWPLERLWEFDVFEVVGFGRQKFVESSKEIFNSFCITFAETFGFNYKLATATDVFFAEASGEAELNQLLQALKYEFKFCYDGHEMSLGSFNIHKSRYCQEFDIKIDESIGESFCLGFGIQRFLQALDFIPLSDDEKIRRLKEML